jgi:hypothetical protein
MRSSLVLIEGDILTDDKLMISLRNAKQIVLGRAPDYGYVVHIAAESSQDLEAAVQDLAAVANVSGIFTLATQLGD